MRGVFVWSCYSFAELGSSHFARNPVRIPHPKIEELALQAQGAGIFALGEYLGMADCGPPSYDTLHVVVMLAQL